MFQLCQGLPRRFGGGLLVYQLAPRLYRLWQTSIYLQPLRRGNCGDRNWLCSGFGSDSVWVVEVHYLGEEEEFEKGSSLDDLGGNINLKGAHADTYKKLASRKPRIGPTKLAPGKTVHSFLEGETSTQVHGCTLRYNHSPTSSDIQLTGASSYYSHHTRSLTSGVRPACASSRVDRLV